MDIQIRTSSGEWTTLSGAQTREILQRSTFVRRYDAIETSPDTVSLLDLAIPAFLEAVPKFKKLLPFFEGEEGKERLQETSSLLSKIPRNTDLWEWPDTQPNRRLLLDLFTSSRVAYYGPASITKMLHLKRPMLIPIIDDFMQRAWRKDYSSAWSTEDLVEVTFSLRGELTLRVPQLNELRRIAQDLGGPWHSLSRLRLFDILCWSNEYRKESELEGDFVES